MHRLQKLFMIGVAGTLGLTVTACNNPNNPAAGDSAAKAPVVDPGPALYKPEAMPKLGDPVVVAEPIVIPNAVVQNDVRVQIPAQVEALIELIATPLEPGTKFDPADPDIVYHPRDEKKTQPYRKLRENDPVRAGQILARLDEQLVALQIESNENLITASDRAIKAAMDAEKALQEQLDQFKKITQGLAKAELLSMEATVARYLENRIQSEREKAKSEGELRNARAQLNRYIVVSPINGRIVKLLKSPREFAKAGDTIMEIQATDRVRVEGKLDVQYADQVRRGMRVTVEPARPVGPDPVANWHRQEVTSVAITGHKDRPMIVSGGLDGAALVWDLFGTRQSHKLPHPAGVGVRSVACTGPLTKAQMVATGGDDGRVRLWDVSNPDKLSQTPLGVMETPHDSAVLAAAFSPDGKYLVTSAGREIYLWDVAARKRKYVLPPEHRDAVTMLRFTPQATLVSVARDKSIRTWKMGTEGAAPAVVIDHRSGAVDVLGVTSDGSRVLFDKDASRLDVVSLVDERSVGTLQSPGGGARFATLALFSADDKLILTAGSDSDQKGELTLWSAPVLGGRGSERKRLLTPKGSTVTCAALSIDPEKPFAVVGTAEGGVHIWTQKPAEERVKPLSGEVVAVLPSDARSVTVRVELANPTETYGEGLQDRSLATIIVDRTPAGNAPPAPVPAPAPVPVKPAGATSQKAPEPSGIIPAGAVIPVTPMPTTPAPMSPVTTPAKGLIIPPAPIPASPAKK